MIEVVSPFKANTSAGRLLERRGDGGYMVIMQVDDARTRRKHIETNSLAKVIFEHEKGDVVCVQYHPKDIKGASPRGMLSTTHGLTRNARRWHDSRGRFSQARTRQPNTPYNALLTMARVWF